MIEYIIPLLSSFSPFWGYALNIVFAGYVLVFVFNFIEKILRGT